jgi:hypothetical protein
MWPSEGSVSEQIIPLVAAAGIKWLATDEAILERTLSKIDLCQRTLTAADLYQPYLVEQEGASVAMIFRNHFISDQIGFVYSRWKVDDALTDFNSHLNNIRISLPEDGRRYLASVILDGENAWEYYPGGGKDFLESFYARLAGECQTKTVRVSDYLQENPPQRRLGKLFAGSWINNNFRIWIGHQEDNQAWDYLHNARLALDGKDNPTAWQELYIAEGSDWCWWYGDDHSSENDAVFDALFRKHLHNIYTLIGRQPPKYLDLPIKQVRAIKPLKEPVDLLQPVLDGEITNYYEWLPAGLFDINRAKGAMHQIETLLKGFYWGFSLTTFYVRLDVNYILPVDELRKFTFAVLTSAPHERKLELSYDAAARRYSLKLLRPVDGGGFEPVADLNSFGVGRIIELGIPFADLAASAGQQIEFVVVVYKEGQEIERWPRGGGITVAVPTATYQEEQWYV